MGEIPPNHPFVHRVFHYFHHPFWGTVPFFWKLPYPSIPIWWILLGSKSICFFHDASGKKFYRGSLLGLENLGVFRGWVVYLINWFICLFVCYWFTVFFIYSFMYVLFDCVYIYLLIYLFICLFGYVSFCLTQILINLVIVHFSWSLNQQVVSNYYVRFFPTISNYPRKLQHTPKTHTPGNPPQQLCKESRYSLFRVCAKGVLKQPHKLKPPWISWGMNSDVAFVPNCELRRTEVARTMDVVEGMVRRILYKRHTLTRWAPGRSLLDGVMGPLLKRPKINAPSVSGTWKNIFKGGPVLLLNRPVCFLKKDQYIPQPRDCCIMAIPIDYYRFR